MVRRSLALLIAALGIASPAYALDFRAVSVPVTILYDAPSALAKKLYLIKEGTPVEVLVQVDGWTKVRDAEGSLAWIDPKALSNQRTLVVTAPMAEIRQQPTTDAPVVFSAEKWVSLGLLDTNTPGWARVKHVDGQSGFVRVTQVWGL